MAKSGRGDTPFSSKEGHSYWTAVRLLLAQLRAESSALHMRQLQNQDSWVARWIPGDPSAAQKEAALIAKQSEELEQMKVSLGSLNLGPDVQPVENLEELRRQTQEMSGIPITASDILTFDFAPSYNFHFDRFQFDWELQRTRRALQVAPRWRHMAMVLGEEMGEYIALHLRRDGYDTFCRSEEERWQRGRGKTRFGFRPTMAACFASLEARINLKNA
eukprot:symbB.v1.2.035951.t1/scaffold4962.1/size32411/2